METKCCNKCNQEKTLACYNKCKTTVSGSKSTCKECMKTYNKVRYKKSDKSLRPSQSKKKSIPSCPKEEYLLHMLDLSKFMESNNF